MSMTTSAAGRKKITQHEGNVLTAYQDQVGVWTIGVGHTAAAGAPAPVKGMKITAAQSDEILSRDLAKFETAVNRYVKVPLLQNEFDACVSLAFNIGPGAFGRSSVVRYLNAGDKVKAADAFLKFNKAGGKVNKGLVNRRAAERLSFLDGASFIKPPRRLDLPVSVPKVDGTVFGGATAVALDPDGFAKGFSEARKHAQQSLVDAGFSMVGKVDGLAGARTVAGLTAFQRVNGLPLTAVFDEATIAVLAGDPKKLPIAYDRAVARAKDVAKLPTATGDIVRDARKVIAGAGGGVVGIPAIAALLDPVQQIREFMASVPVAVWIGLVCLGLCLVIWYVWSIQGKAVAAHRVGDTA